MKTKENEKTAHPNLKTLENGKQVNDAIKEPKAAEKHDKKESIVEKDNKHLKSMREKAKAWSTSIKIFHIKCENES